MGGMAIFRDFYPNEDATVVARLREAGAVILGKLQMTEGAYSDHHPSVVPPKNPWNQDYWTGISSSGSAVAIAAGLCYASPASDTGGSIRWPCAATGLTGIKPTWGRVSRFGVFELAASLDHVGTMARSAADAAVMLGVIAGSDPKDPTALVDPVPDYLSADDIQGLRIGIDECWNSEDVDEPVRKVMTGAIRVFGDLGGIVVNVSVPDVTQAVVDWSPACSFIQFSFRFFPQVPNAENQNNYPSFNNLKPFSHSLRIAENLPTYGEGLSFARRSVNCRVNRSKEKFVVLLRKHQR